MCGIFGAISQNEKVVIKNAQYISKMLEHRGPDDEGWLVFNEKKAVHLSREEIDRLISSGREFENDQTGILIHRRLSIVDLSTGHQPMSYKEHKFWIVLNGEIYNYREIREELKGVGHKFNTESDTEVVLAAYCHWGENCTMHFNGMWAFCIYDTAKRILFCSRDRLGIKPFYYRHGGNRFLFGSEMKSIKDWDSGLAGLNIDKIREYLYSGQIVVGANEETIFTNILQLTPGHSLIVKLQDLTVDIKRYWELEININRSLSFERIIERFRELFLDSVKLRLRSDVEVGSCLSGGIDSSSIVSLASGEFGQTFNTFTAVWPGTRHDESNFAVAVNNKYNCLSHLIHSNLENLPELIDKITFYQELPIGGSSLIAQWFVMQEARKYGIKVLLDGQGADEILSGYPFYIFAYINELFKSFKWRKFFTDRGEWNYSGFSYAKIVKTLIKNKLNKPVPKLPISESFLKDSKSELQYSWSGECYFLPEYLKQEIQKSRLPLLLHFEDRSSMAHSVESRVPFLDYRLVEFAVNLPSSQKFKGALTKNILREAMKKYLPDEIYNRRDKIGFSTPIENQVSKGTLLYREMEDIILNSPITEEKWIKERSIDISNIFSLYSLARFLNQYS